MLSMQDSTRIIQEYLEMDHPGKKYKEVIEEVKQLQQKNRSILRLFRLLNECYSTKQLSVEFGEALYDFRVIPCSHKISTRYYGVIHEMILSGMVFE